MRDGLRVNRSSKSTAPGLGGGKESPGSGSPRPCVRSLILARLQEGHWSLVNYPNDALRKAMKDRMLFPM